MLKIKHSIFIYITFGSIALLTCCINKNKPLPKEIVKQSVQDTSGKEDTELDFIYNEIDHMFDNREQDTSQKELMLEMFSTEHARKMKAKYGAILKKDPYILFLRKTFDDFLNENYIIGDNISLIGLHGLKLYDKEYFRSKFFVGTIENSEGGGMNLQIGFVDRPDRVFFAWIYDKGNAFRLNAFIDANLNIEYIKAIQKNTVLMDPKNGF